MLNNPTNEPVIACNPNAVPVEERERWMEVGQQFYTAVEEIRELPDGYELRVPGDAAMLLVAAEYVSRDRLCCAFLRWSLVVEPNSGPLWLQMTGGEGVKAYLRA